MNTLNEEINDGGPAFPCTTGSDGGVAFCGMSLRDWFAGQALISIISGNTEWAKCGGKPDLDSVVSDSFKIADAMIAQREKK